MLDCKFFALTVCLIQNPWTSDDMNQLRSSKKGSSNLTGTWDQLRSWMLHSSIELSYLLLINSQSDPSEVDVVESTQPEWRSGTKRHRNLDFLVCIHITYGSVKKHMNFTICSTDWMKQNWTKLWFFSCVTTQTSHNIYWLSAICFQPP